MKRAINRLGFSFRFAFKNLIRFRLRSILLIFSFIALFVTVLLGASTKMFLTSYYYGELENKYREIDFSMGITLNSDLRFFSIRPLTESTDLNTVVDDYAPFFEMDTLVEINGVKQYVKTMASTLDNFVKVSNPIHYSNPTLDDDEVIITESLADTYQLNRGDFITLYLGTATRDYLIVDIVADGGLFLNETIYLNKDGSLSFFLTALNPSLASLNPIFLTQFYNQVYFEVKEGVTDLQAISFLQSITQFSNLNFQVSIDHQAVDQQIRRNVSFFNLIVVIVFLVILLVMQTTFMLYFEEKKKGFAVIDLLGGSHLFSYGVVMLEILIFFTLSIIASVFIANSVIDNGMKFVGSSATYQLDFMTVFWSALAMLVIYLITSVYYFVTFNKESSIQQTVTQSIEKEMHWIPMFVIWIASFGIYFLANFNFVFNWIGYYQSVIRSVAAFAILFTTAFLLIFLFSKLQKIQKKPLIFSLQLKILLAKKSFYQYIAVLLVCFVSIFLLVLANDHMDKRMSKYGNEFKVDFVLTNFISRYDETYTQISELDSVENAAKVGYLQNIEFATFQQNLNSLVSIESELIGDYFNLELDETSLTNLESLIPTIILPQRFRLLYDMNIGDQVYLILSPAHGLETFEIGGFYEKEIGDMAFTNLHLFPIYDDISQNTIFVNAKDGKVALQNELINLYSKNMVYVLDFQTIVDTRINQMRTATDYLTIILSTIIGCFILSIFNHSILLLGQMKDSYARLFVLGFSKQKMTILLIKESIIMLIILTLSSILAFILLSEQLSSLILLSGEYEDIHLALLPLLLGTLLIVIVFVLTKIIYIWGVSRINPSNVVKTY
ncbi:MAG: hypothetical protein K9L02_03485 [Acholeplasmataceae bacterium]|nr:hypothetical protein [Acholeplasmataceae bacterium]